MNVFIEISGLRFMGCIIGVEELEERDMLLITRMRLDVVVAFSNKISKTSQQWRLA